MTGSVIFEHSRADEKKAAQKGPICVEDVVRLVLKLRRRDLQINDVSVETEFRDSLPEL
jgi:hypothetical protein